MTQEDRELLIKDLCARLPYGVICDIYNDTCTIKEKLLIGGLSHFCDDTICVRPYLRSMSSMTDDEKEELTEEHKKDERIYIDVIKRVANGDKHARGTAVPHFAADWCNEHHFDCRGLIERELAIAVTEENNPYKNDI